MKGRRIVLTIAALLTVLLAATVLVTRPAGGGPATATALGEITWIDYGAKSLEIDLRRSNRLVTQDPLIVFATEATRIVRCIGGGESVPIEFDDIDDGEWVRVDGMMDGDYLIARRITVDPDNIPRP